MSLTRPNAQAFPSESVSTPGLTIREKFAETAMGAILSSVYSSEESINKFIGNNWPDTKTIAKIAVDAADDLIEALNNKKS